MESLFAAAESQATIKKNDEKFICKSLKVFRHTYVGGPNKKVHQYSLRPSDLRQAAYIQE